MSLEQLEARQLFTGTITKQIIVDQFGWRADAPSKVAMLADPIQGQNSGTPYVPGATFQVRNSSTNAIAFSGSTVQWNNGATDSNSGDEVWTADFSSLTTPGTYYIYDPTNNLRSYDFKIDNNVDNSILLVSDKTFYYSRSDTAITAQYGGDWTHALDHQGPNQDEDAMEMLNGSIVPNSQLNVSGGWFDAGDYDKFAPFTTNTIWNMLTAYEWNPSAFGDNENIPQSNNGVPDTLDNVKVELDWLLKMQGSDGGVHNRVAPTSYSVGTNDPSTDTNPRYYTQETTWATASFAASAAHAAQVFSAFNGVYKGYATTLLNAAEKAWDYLANIHPAMYPTDGTDDSGTSGGNALAANAASSNSAQDERYRLMAAAELFKATGDAKYDTYFQAHYLDAAASTDIGGFNPLTAGWPHFDAGTGWEFTRADYTYATAAGADPTIVASIKTAFANAADGQIVPEYENAVTSTNDSGDPYRAFMWGGQLSWGSNQVKAEWGNLLQFAIHIDADPANDAIFSQVAEEYLHYIDGRNPLSEVYLTNMGSTGANLGAENSVMHPWTEWFKDSSPYNGDPVPGYLVGGPDQYYPQETVTDPLSPPVGEPPAKAYADTNTDWDSVNNSTLAPWEFSEPAIYYQAQYNLLLSQYATSAPPLATGTASGNVYNDANENGKMDTTEAREAHVRIYADVNNNGHWDNGEPIVSSNTKGFWQLTGLAPGPYTIREQMPAGQRLAGSASGSFSVNVVAMKDSGNNNFANTSNPLVAGSVFSDVNSDALWTGSEAGIAGQWVFVDLNDDNVWEKNEPRVQTNKAGHFTITGLTPGTYHIIGKGPAGSTHTAPVGRKSIGVLLASGGLVGHVNFGFHLTSATPGVGSTPPPFGDTTIAHNGWDTIVDGDKNPDIWF